MRIYLFTVLALFMSGKVAAQIQAPTESLVRIGVRAGGNSVLPLEKVDNATYQPTVSYHAGLVASFGRGAFTLQPEVNYSQRTVSASFNEQGISLTGKVITNRLEVPLLVRAAFGSPDRPRFFVNAGPYGGYALSERYNAKLVSIGNLDPQLRQLIESAVASLNNQKATYEGNTGRLSYGVTGGVGVIFPVGPGQLTLEGRALYELGNNEDRTGSFNFGSFSNVRDTKYSLLQASVGYLIPIGGR